ncbi:unnamed protein product [Arabidopsis thaliana]|uniref:Uncharacterized protein n=1 Tax=Arabidopsis thaliana TaxID=3702 RepID=A0A5S9XJS5_ARATH|nr:unnamed protein product [Arabidopsis thaliana]
MVSVLDDRSVSSNRRSRIVRTYYEIIRRTRQREKLRNDKETYGELENIEVIEEKPRDIKSVVSIEDKNEQKLRDIWVISLNDKMKTLGDNATTSWDNLCIYRVPPYLQENDTKSYMPQIVSIGPFHHGHKHLMPMERHKWRAVNMVMARTKHDIKMYIDAMKELEEKARACYQGPINMKRNEFIEMLVLDGVFIIEIFKGTSEGFQEIGYAPNDPVFGMRGLMQSIRRDMVMLENQLPWSVLTGLLHLQRPDVLDKVDVRLFQPFFQPLLPTREVLTEERGLHCLDVLRRGLLQSSGTSDEDMSMVDKQPQQLIHCVTELRNAGVEFMRKETGHFWDIEFKNGYLKIPKLLIHDGTKSLFLNLIAFEQCHIKSSKKITSYIIFMDNLINSSEDVSYLHHYGIIENWLGSDSGVSDLFNGLCKEVIFDPNDGYLSELSGEVNIYYRPSTEYIGP